MDACNLAKKNSLMFSRESKYDPKHENTSEAATFSYLQGHLDATRASKSSNDGKIQLLALQNESIVGGWTFHGRRCSSVILLKGKVCDSGFRKSKEFCGQVVVKRPLLWKDQCKKSSFMLLLGPLKIVALCLPIGARNRGIERDRKGISVLQLLQHHHYLVRDSWQPMNQLTILSLDPSKSCHLRQGGWTHFGPSGRGPPCRRFAWTRVWQVAASKVPDCRHFGASWPCCSSSSSWMVQGLREWLHHWNFTLGEYRNVISEPINAEGLNQQQWMPSHRTLDLHDVRRKCRHGYFTFSWFITKSESYSPDVRRRRRTTTTKLLSAPLKPGTQ